MEQSQAVRLLWISGLRDELRRIPPEGLVALRKVYRESIIHELGNWVDTIQKDSGSIPDDLQREVLDAIHGASRMTAEDREYWRTQLLVDNSESLWWDVTKKRLGEGPWYERPIDRMPDKGVSK